MTKRQWKLNNRNIKIKEAIKTTPIEDIAKEYNLTMSQIYRILAEQYIYKKIVKRRLSDNRAIGGNEEWKSLKDNNGSD